MLTKKLRVYSVRVGAMVPVGRTKAWPFDYHFQDVRCWFVQGDDGTSWHATHAEAIACASRRAFAAAMEEETC